MQAIVVMQVEVPYDKDVLDIFKGITMKIKEQLYRDKWHTFHSPCDSPCVLTEALLSMSRKLETSIVLLSNRSPLNSLQTTVPDQTNFTKIFIQHRSKDCIFPFWPSISFSEERRSWSFISDLTEAEFIRLEDARDWSSLALYWEILSLGGILYYIYWINFRALVSLA